MEFKNDEKYIMLEIKELGDKATVGAIAVAMGAYERNMRDKLRGMVREGKLTEVRHTEGSKNLPSTFRVATPEETEKALAMAKEVEAVMETAKGLEEATVWRDERDQIRVTILGSTFLELMSRKPKAVKAA